MAPTNTAASAQELLGHNGQYAKGHQPQLLFAEVPADEPSPRPKTFIFCCFDPRIDPEAFLGLKPWGKYPDALVVRNGGGYVGSAIDSLIALDYFIGTFEDVFVIQHTDCGALHFTEEDIRKDLKAHRRGSDEAIDALQFGSGLGLTLEERVRKNVQQIRDSPYVRDELKARTKGMIYDIKTGKLTEVV